MKKPKHQLPYSLELTQRCTATYMLALNDTLNVLQGKWKVPVMGALSVGKKRFSEIEREIPGINPRMLSKELRELEVNGMVNRTVYDSFPVTIEYSLTPSGISFKRVLDVMVEWGVEHRTAVLAQNSRRKKSAA
ncbi:MAG: helix-turn-helix transcriptional regulator [Bacteroidetes bacterium]|nr:helix-turn-helix transcriptional regulator [Bacteroidota bacterium]